MYIYIHVYIYVYVYIYIHIIEAGRLRLRSELFPCLRVLPERAEGSCVAGIGGRPRGGLG